MENFVFLHTVLKSSLFYHLSQNHYIMYLENNIIIYQTEDGQTSLEVRLENENVWLTANQMALLFNREDSNIRRHILNVFSEGELQRDNNVHFLHVNGVKKPVPFYSLDVIISVGYRVKSLNGTRFRMWANNVLKQYLVKGYAINDRIRRKQIGELRQLVQMVGRTISQQELPETIESQDLLDVVVDYTYALDTLDNYDYERLAIGKTTKEEPFHATYENAMHEIGRLRDKFGGSALFGHEKDGSFKSSIGQIYQTFDGIELYPSVEEKAAMLLYLVTKNHSFSDGNKRIAATLFLWFLNNNRILYNTDGSKRIADGTLVALTLMIAESRPEEKDVMVKVVVNLIGVTN